MSALIWLALVYSAAVIAVRKVSKDDLPWPVAVFFFALVAVVLLPSLALGMTRIPGDLLLTFHPWRGDYPEASVHNAEIADLILQIAPWSHLVRESWMRFEAPLWNASSALGYPLLANGQSAALSPIRLLALPLDLAASLAFEAGLKLLIALVGMWLWARGRGLSVQGSIAAALSFGFSTFLTCWLDYPLATVAVFLPVLFIAIDRMMERTTRWRFLFAVVAFCMLLVNGHAETTAHVVLIGILWTAYLVFRKPERAAFARTLALAGAGITAALISAPAWMPLAEMIPRSLRFAILGGRPAPIIRLGLDELLLFLQPDYFGSMTMRTDWGPVTTEVVTGYAGILGIIGWLAVLTDTAWRRKWRDPIFAMALTVPLWVAISQGTSPIADWFHKLPLYGLTLSGRFRLVVCFVLAACAGRALDMMWDARGRKIVAFSAVVVGGLLVAVIAATQFPDDAARSLTIRTSVPRLMVVVAALAAILAGSRSRRVTPVVIALVVADLLFCVHTRYPRLQVEDVFPRLQIVEQLKEDAASIGDSPYRISGIGVALFPNTGAVYGLEDVRANDPVAPSKAMGFLRVFGDYTSWEYLPMLRGVDHPAFDFLNVRYLLTNPIQAPTSPRWTKIVDGPEGRLFRNEEWVERFFAPRRVVVARNRLETEEALLEPHDWAASVVVDRLPSGIPDTLPDGVRPAIDIHQKTPRSLEVETSSPVPFLLASSQTDWPGWTARIDDGSLLDAVRVNELFLGFGVPAGEHRITIAYRPQSFYRGVAISLATMAALAFWLIAGLWRERERPSETPAPERGE